MANLLIRAAVLSASLFFAALPAAGREIDAQWLSKEELETFADILDEHERAKSTRPEDLRSPGIGPGMLERKSPGITRKFKLRTWPEAGATPQRLKLRKINDLWFSEEAAEKMLADCTASFKRFSKEQAEKTWAGNTASLLRIEEAKKRLAGNTASLQRFWREEVDKRFANHSAKILGRKKAEKRLADCTARVQRLSNEESVETLADIARSLADMEVAAESLTGPELQALKDAVARLVTLAHSRMAAEEDARRTELQAETAARTQRLADMVAQIERMRAAKTTTSQIGAVIDAVVPPSLTDLLAEFDRLRREHDRWLLNQAKEADQQRRKHDQWLLDQAKEVDRLRRKHDQWLLENAKRDTQKLAQGAQALGQKAAKESVNATKDTFATITTGKPHGDIAIGATKAGKDVGRALDKFHNDTVAEVGRFGSNLDELVQAVVHAVEDELANAMRNMTDAAKRISEGKVIDALWHSAVDPAKGSSKNWAKAATDSSYLNAVGQTVATVYGGGAGGAAAYAAWLTYEQTGDFEAAIKQGIISGATTYASAGASEIPADAKRIVTKAAITAAAVAVNGGSEEDMKKGALIAGGVVILQVAYREYTGTELDPSPSKGDALCKQSPGADCAPSPAAYDEDGKLDKRKLSPEEKTRPQVGVGAAKGQAGMALETSKTMTTISRVPVMNAMALGHDIFVDDVHRITGLDGQTLDMVSKATIVPAMVIAYTAGGAPVYTFVQEVGIKHHRQNNAE